MKESSGDTTRWNTPYPAVTMDALTGLLITRVSEVTLNITILLLFSRMFATSVDSLSSQLKHSRPTRDNLIPTAAVVAAKVFARSRI